MTPADIKALRLAIPEYQDEFAARLGVSRQTISDWETGRRTPSIENQRKLKELKLIISNNVDFS